MKKKIIRLTEDDLKNIISESVKRIIREEKLNELDWKTYMNAAKKSHDTDDDNYRSEKFLDAASNSYQKKYNATPRRGERDNWWQGRGKIGYTDMETQTDGDYDENIDDYVAQRTSTTFDNGDEFGPSVDSEFGDVYDGDVYNIIRNPKLASSYLANKVKNASPEWNDVRDYTHGNSKYVKGKGWNK